MSRQAVKSVPYIILIIVKISVRLNNLKCGIIFDMRSTVFTDENRGYIPYPNLSFLINVCTNFV